MRCLIICSHNKDRSPALEKHLGVEYPNHQYRSAGINQYHCGKNKTHYITQEDIDWCEFIVFCEEVHQDVVMRNFSFYSETNPESKKSGLVLALGHYEKGNITNDYLQRAKEKLKKHLE